MNDQNHTRDRLVQRVKELLADATRGPWRLCEMLNGSFHIYGEGEYDIIFPRIGKKPDANAELIVLALDMAETIERLEKRLKEWQESDYNKEALMVERGTQIELLREALIEIEKGEGSYSMDQLTFANNTIENLTAIARNALIETKAKQ